MATITLPYDELGTTTDNKHLEIFSLIWLDISTNMNETRNTEEKLRSIINHLKKFQNIKDCQQYIEQTTLKDRLVLIVSGQLGKEIVPLIHQLRQVISIYVYCMDKKRNKQWTSKYLKIKAVVTDLNELISCIQTDHKIQKKIEEPLTINIITTQTDKDKSTMGVNGEFVFSQILIDCLLRLKYTQIDKYELIDGCKNEYKRNNFELNNILEFEETYSSNKVLSWYTRESFFYKTLNAALRKPDIHMIFLFRSFIYDIYRQLQKYQSKTRLKVYRSQTISTDELKTLQESLGQFISINSFFSTSADYKRALSFLNTSNGSNDLAKVLFQIDADPKMVTTKPFANISQYSDFPEESEVLFMLGSIFRLEHIHCNDDGIWIIRMTLYNDNEHDLKQILQDMKQQIGTGEITLRTLGNILWEMGKLDLAEKYLIRLLNQLLPNDPLHTNLYEDLAKLASQTTNYDMSMQWRRKSVEFKNKYPLASKTNINQSNKPTEQIISPISTNYKWKQHAITVAGGYGQGSQLNQLYRPNSVYVDDDHQSIYISDSWNHRIVEWKFYANMSQVIAGGNDEGNRMNQLDHPTDLIIDKNNEFIIICDSNNKRLVRWSRENDTYGQTILSNIDCYSLAMDKNGNIYVCDCEKSEVRRLKKGEKKGTIVAGGNGKGNYLNQLNGPTFIFVDQDYSVYVSDSLNHRVMKWMKDAKEGTVVAGGHGQGHSLRQLSYPEGVIVDDLGNAYVSDSGNDRIICWSNGSKEGRIILGGNGKGQQLNQLDGPTGLSFDRENNLYVVDWGNHRVQKFAIDSS